MHTLPGPLRRPAPLHHRWRLDPTVHAAGGDDGPSSSGSGGDSGVDIDQLARLLSQKAQMLRESYDDGDLSKELGEGYEPTPEAGDVLPGQSLVITSANGLSLAELEAQMFREIGEGGFESDDFEILQQLGRISVQQASSSGVSEPRTAVIAYVASLMPRLALPGGQVVSLLKEYLPVAKAVAYNELLVMSKLTGIPQEKYVAAQTPAKAIPPVVPLLGFFVSAPTQDASTYGGTGKADEDSVWLVYKWEGLRPLNLFFDEGPPKPKSSWFKRKEELLSEAWEARFAMLKSISRGLLGALVYIHGKGVAHGSLSNGTVLISSTDDQMADDLMVKLDNFGFGRLTQTSGPGASQATGAAQKQDLQAAALVLAETFTYGTAVSDQGRLARPSLQRLLFEIYSDDISQFRDYCESEPSLAFDGFLQLLDDRDQAGWDFLNLMLKGEWSAKQLMSHPFLKAK